MIPLLKKRKRKAEDVAGKNNRVKSQRIIKCSSKIVCDEFGIGRRNTVTVDIVSPLKLFTNGNEGFIKQFSLVWHT